MCSSDLSTVQAKRASDVAVQANVELAEIRFDPRFVPQSLQLRPPHQLPLNIQIDEKRRPLRMAPASGWIRAPTPTDAGDYCALD